MSNEDLKKHKSQEKVRANANAGEIAELVRERGVELTDEQLEQVAGGNVWDDEISGYRITCGFCGGTFDCNLANPRYCQLCGIEMSW